MLGLTRWGLSFGRREEILQKGKQLKAKTILEMKRINCKIIETGAEIVSYAYLSHFC
jgi:hypothetical protein